MAPPAKRFRALPAERRAPADRSEAVALFTAAAPAAAASPYHEFARSPPTALFGRPARWPGPEGSATTARLLWSASSLHVCWELEGPARAPLRPGAVEPAALATLEGGAVPEQKRKLLLDERVEVFLWQPAAGSDGDSKGQVYHSFEINYDGVALAFRSQFGGPKDFEWDADGACAVRTQELAVGWGDTSSPVPAAGPGDLPQRKRIVFAEISWQALGFDTSREIRVGLHRAEYPAPGAWPEHPGVLSWPAGRPAGAAEVSEHRFVWTSWVDPGDEEVNFHRPAFFGRLVLAPAEAAPADCSCLAARIFSSRRLSVVRSPLASLAECPQGSILVQAKYASLCGSDLPYFREATKKAASCYWDRDGFCGHEVIGVVLESKSDRFAAGDAVMALPSSYFKAHASSKQEWYKEDVHGVLLRNFPVRGGFSQVYTSHELYSCRLRECVPRMLVAQGLGTVLRMAKRIGPVIGKTVAILGQGQNGLLATRLMAQLCARDIIAVDPLGYRRDLALQMGASVAVGPEDAQAAVDKATSGRGADVVLEMVGHNKTTINDAMELAACAGTVVAFGVPDDRIYDTFEFSLFFRKNITLVASVIPDPGTDFPDAVRLIESGRFSTEGYLTHTMPLSDLQRAFEMAADYKDGVVKLVVDLG